MPKRVDANQPEIVDALRKVGASVQHLHETGYGVPDILVGFRGFNFLLEIKGKQGKLNPLQHRWHCAWQGQVCVVRSVDEALEAIGAMTFETFFDVLEGFDKP